MADKKPEEDRSEWLDQGAKDEDVMEGDEELSMVMKKHAEGRLITGEIDEEKKGEEGAVIKDSSKAVSKYPAKECSLYARETVDLFRSTFKAVVENIVQHGFYDSDAEKPMEKFLNVEAKHFMDNLKKSRVLDSSDEVAVAQLFWEEIVEKSRRHRIAKASLLNCIFPACYFRP